MVETKKVFVGWGGVGGRKMQSSSAKGPLKHAWVHNLLASLCRRACSDTADGGVGGAVGLQAPTDGKGNGGFVPFKALTAAAAVNKAE